MTRTYNFTMHLVDSTREAYIDGQRLDPVPSQHIRNHSPDGFSWGYGGSGPAQLALAILLYLTREPELAQIHYQELKREFIAGLPQKSDNHNYLVEIQLTEKEIDIIYTTNRSRS